MKKRIIIVAALLGSVTLQAQGDQFRHEVNAFFGVGTSSFGYDLTSGRSSTLSGGNFGVGYTYFLSEYFGVGTGLELASYNSKLKKASFNNAIFGLTDESDGEMYDFHSEITNYNEKQSARLLQIPLLLKYQGEGKHRFYAAAGGRVGIPIDNTYKSTANINNKGYFRGAENEAKTQRFMGFGQYDNYSSKGELSLKTVCIASLETGVKWMLSNKISLYTGVYFDYGLNDIIDEDRMQSVVDHIAPGDFNIRSLSSSSTTYGTASTPFTEKVVPYAIGIKFSLAFSN